MDSDLEYCLAGQLSGYFYDPDFMVEDSHSGNADMRHVVYLDKTFP